MKPFATTSTASPSAVVVVVAGVGARKMLCRGRREGRRVGRLEMKLVVDVRVYVYRV